jgi:L-asparaginase II
VAAFSLVSRPRTGLRHFPAVFGYPPAHVATIRRGTALEAVIRGHVAVVDVHGALLGSAGDPEAATTLRSCVKPLQALPFVRRAAGAMGATDEEIAVACSSHSGEPVHVATVRTLLGRSGLREDALSCGPQLPFDEEAARALLVSGAPAGRIHNNCSGKHAAMLAACVASGWPVSGYAEEHHPLQVEIRQVMGGFAGVDLSRQPHGIDGCGLPTYELPLGALARMLAAATADHAFQRCQEAMAAHPHLVAGRGRFDTAVLATAGDAVTVKIGGSAVWVAVRRPGGPAMAIKLEAGDATALPAVALAALKALGWIDATAFAGSTLGPFVRPAVRNWEGTEVGSVTAEPGWLRGLSI